MATATEPKAIKTLNVTCPHCLSADDTVKLDLNDLSEVTCSGCDEVFSPAEAAAVFAALAERWEAVARWVESAPPL